MSDSNAESSVSTFSDLGLEQELLDAIELMGFDKPTEIQLRAIPQILSSEQDLIALAQTGTGKTFAYMLPILQDLKFSKEINPRVLVMVPTRELVLQVVEEIEKFGKYSSRW